MWLSVLWPARQVGMKSYVSCGTQHGDSTLLCDLLVATQVASAPDTSFSCAMWIRFRRGLAAGRSGVILMPLLMDQPIWRRRSGGSRADWGVWPAVDAGVSG